MEVAPNGRREQKQQPEGEKAKATAAGQGEGGISGAQEPPRLPRRPAPVWFRWLSFEELRRPPGKEALLDAPRNPGILQTAILAHDSTPNGGREPR